MPINEITIRDICPICENKVKECFKVFKKNNKDYDVAVCDNCGFVFQYAIYPKEHYHSLPCSYPKNYLEHSKNRARYILDFCHEYIKDKRRISVLDIGSGKGGVIYYIEQLRLGAVCTGMTLENQNDWIERIWDTNLGLRTVTVDFESDFVFNQKFDFIILSHTLEHFIDPNVIKKTANLLMPNGIVYIEVPDLYHAEYRTKSVWTPEHLSYFTLSSLQNLMHKYKFRLWKFNSISDSKIWGNIKTVWKYDSSNVDIAIIRDSNVYEKYKSRRLAKFIQRLKHKFIEYGTKE